MPAVWPPTPRPGDQTVRRRTGTQPGAPEVELRAARLWDRPVLVDDGGQVWCQGCLQTVPLAALLTWDNPHLVRPPGAPELARSSPVPLRADGWGSEEAR